MCPVLLTQDYTFSQAEQLPSCIRRKKTLGVKMMVFWNIRVLASEYKPCLLGARICRQNHDKTQLKKSADISNLGYTDDHTIQWQANWFLQKKYRKKVLHRESMEEREENNYWSFYSRSKRGWTEMKATIAPKKWIFKATQAEKWSWRDTE